MKRVIQLGLLGLAAAVVGTAPAAAQGRRSDSLQTLGVGARSIGMGGAFVASPEDLTAIFWNPAGLSYLLFPEVSVDFRTLPKATFRGLAQNIDIGSTGLQYGFFGVAYPLRGGKRDDDSSLKARRGVVAFARTLGGYEQTLDTTTAQFPSIARYWYNSIGYGRALDNQGKWRFGGSVHLVELNVFNDDPTSPTGKVEGSTEGVTFGLGLLYSPQGESGRFRVGLSYLNPTRVGDIGAAGGIFGDQINGRINLGTRMLLAKGKGGDRQLIWTTEGRYYFGGDDSPNVLERRSPTYDIHTGFEYAFPPFRNTGTKPFLRVGFLTRNASDDRLFFNDRLATAGVGLKVKELLQLDAAAEYSLRNQEVSFLTSLRYYLGRAFSGSSRPKKVDPNTPPPDPLNEIKDPKARDIIRTLQEQIKALQDKVEKGSTPSAPIREEGGSK